MGTSILQFQCLMISYVAMRAVWGLRPVEVMNMSKLKNIHPGEVFLEEFMAPMGISQNRIATDFLANIVISNFFSETAKVNKEFLADCEYYLPVNHVIIVDCDVSEADGLLHGYASSRRDSAKCLKR